MKVNRSKIPFLIFELSIVVATSVIAFTTAVTTNLAETIDIFSDHYPFLRLHEGLFAGTVISIVLLMIVIRRWLNARSSNKELLEKNIALNEALKENDALQRLIPICAECKKVRNDSGYWSDVEHYFATHTRAQFSHGLCPECEERFARESREAIKKYQSSSD
ncbi:MAG: hypothetical protein AAF558_08770 [Verrucomicrobiota bacterium]